jgi:hypothetical protein
MSEVPKSEPATKEDVEKAREAIVAEVIVLRELVRELMAEVRGKRVP